MLVLLTTRLSIIGFAWFPDVTAQSCSTRTRLSVTWRRIRSCYLQKKCAEYVLEGIVVKDRFRRLLNGGCHYFSILNVHVNYVCGASRSICFNLLLLIRTWCVQEGETSLADEFNEYVQRGKFGESSLLQTAFSSAPVSWRSFGNRCLLDPEARRGLNAVTLLNCRTPIACDPSREWIPRLRGPKANDIVWEAVMKRSQDPGADTSRDLSLLFCCLSLQFDHKVSSASECSVCWPSTTFSMGDFSDDRYRWRAVRCVFSTWCR